MYTELPGDVRIAKLAIVLLRSLWLSRNASMSPNSARTTQRTRIVHCNDRVMMTRKELIQ